MTDRELSARAVVGLRVGFALVVLGAWYLVALTMGDLFLAPPHAVLASLGRSVESGEFLKYLGPTAYILAIGAGLGVVTGVPAGLLIGRIRWLYFLTEAPINIFYTTPLVALIPFILVIVGFNYQSKILIVFLFTVLPVVINTSSGVRTVDADLVELSRSFCATEWTVWRDVIVPGSLPAIVTGLRLGLIHALVGAVLADFYAGASGFGYLIILYSNRFDIAGALGPVLVLAATGTAIAALLKSAQRRLSPWQGAP
ncbi:MAG: ABC transporter permease subunit [Propionibacteriales bacterium]|nr:ABC transporter permease subunit [Propionibacteriales bacterium]